MEQAPQLWHICSNTMTCLVGSTAIALYSHISAHLPHDVHLSGSTFGTGRQTFVSDSWASFWNT